MHLTILLIVWGLGMVLLYAWYLAATLRRAFREVAVAEPAPAGATAEHRPGDMLSYAKPPQHASIARRWPVLQAISGAVVVLLPLTIPVAVLLGLGAVGMGRGVVVPSAVALAFIVLASAAVAGIGLRDQNGRPAAANWRRLGWFALGWVLLAAGAGALMEWRVQRMIDVSLAKADALGERYAVVAEVGAAAAALYTRGGVVPHSSLQFDEQWEVVAPDGSVSPPPPFPEVHTSRIAPLREAAAMSTSGLVPAASSYNVTTLLPHLAGMRQAAMLLRRHAVNEARAGRIRSAIDDLNTIRGMADHCEQGLTLVESLVGAGMRGVANDGMQQVLPMVTDERELDRIRLESPAGRMAAARRMLQCELGVFTRRTVAMALRQESGITIMGLTGSTSASSPLTPLYRIIFGPSDVTMFDATVDALPTIITDDPAAVAQRMTGGNPLLLPRKDQSILSSILTPSLTRAVDMQVQSAAMAELSHAAVAATRFRIRRNRLPQSFEELVAAGLLPAVPTDPFTRKPMRFATNDGYVFIYTVGPSRTDGGGKPFVLGRGGSAKQSDNSGFILSPRPLWELKLTPPGATPQPLVPAPALVPLMVPATQETE